MSEEKRPARRKKKDETGTKKKRPSSSPPSGPPEKPPGKKTRKRAVEKPPSFPPFTVIRDTREKKPWDFPVSNFCAGVLEKTLPTGDYTLLGHETTVVIERKGSVLELAGNLFGREDKDRFLRELERLRAFPFPFLIGEFDWNDVARFPYGWGVPAAVRKRFRVSPGFLLKRLIEIQLDFPSLRVQLTGKAPRGREFAVSLFKRIAERGRLVPPGEATLLPPLSPPLPPEEPR